MDSASTPPKQSTQPASSTGPPPAAASGVQKRYRAAPAKTFQCRGYGECRMVFSRSEHLARHIRKHTGERPFACHCGKQFSRLDNLRQHAQTVHSDKHAENEAMMRELTSLHTQLAANSSKANRDSVSVSGSNRQPSAASGPNPGNDKIGGRQSHSPHPPYDHHPSQPQFSGGPTGPSVPQLGIPIGYHTYQPHVTGYPPHHPPPSPHFPHPGSPDQYPHHPAAAGYYPHPPGQPNQGYGSPAYPPAYPHYPAAPGSVRYAPYPSPYPHGQYPPGSTLQPGPYSAGGAQQPSSPSTSAPASTSSPAPHTPLTPNPTQVAATAGPGHSFLGPTASPRGAGASGQPFLGRGGDSGSASPHPNSAVDGQSFRAQQSTTNGDHSGDPSPSPSSAAPAGTAGGPTSPANGQYGINGNGIHGGKSSPSSPGSGSGYDQQQQQHAESGAATNGVEQGFREREGATPIIRASAASGRNHRYAAAASRENQSESNDGCQQQQQFFDGEGDGRGITKRRRELGHQEGDEREISTSAVDPRYRPAISTSSSTIHAESGISSRFPQVTSNSVPHQQQHFRDFNGASGTTHGGFGASEQHSFQSASNSHPKREIFTPGVHSQFQQQTVVPPVFTGRGPDEHFRGGSSFQQQQSKPFQSGYPGNGIVSGGRFDGSATGGPPQSFPDPGYNNGLRNGMGYSEGYHGGSDVNNSNNSSFVGQQYPASTASAVDGRPRSSRSFLSGGFGFNLQHQQSQLSQSQDNDSPFSFHPPPEDASGVVFGLSRTLPRPTSSGRPLSSSGFIRPFSSGGIGSTGGRPFSSSGRPPSSSLFRPFSSGGGAGFGFGFGFGGSRPGTGGSTTDPASYAFSRGVKRPYTAGSDGGGANGFGNSATTGGTTGVGGREYADGSPFRFAIGGPLPSTRNAANDDANADERPQSRRLSVMELCTPPASAAGRQSQQFQRIGGPGEAASARPTTSEGSTRWSGNTLVADEGEDELSDGREIDVDVVTESEPSRSEFTSSQTANEETARTPAFHGELDETQSKASHVYSDSFVSFERGQQQRRSEHFESGTDDGSRRVVDGFQLTQPTIYETAAETAPSSAVDESFGNASLPGADYAQSSRERFISNHGLSSESIQSAADIRSGHFAVGSAASSRLEPQHTIVRPSSTPAALFGLKSEEQLQSVFPAVTGPGAKSASPGPTRPRSFVSGPDVDGEFQLQQLQQQQFGVDVKSGTVFCADNMGGGSHSRRSSAPRSSTNAAPSTPTSSAASESGPARGSATVIGLGAGI